MKETYMKPTSRPKGKIIRAWAIWYNGKDGEDKAGFCHDDDEGIHIFGSKQMVIQELKDWEGNCGRYYRIVPLICRPITRRKR